MPRLGKRSVQEAWDQFDKERYTELGRMRVADLKALCREQGLPVTGVKMVLMTRLMEAEAKDSEPPKKKARKVAVEEPEAAEEADSGEESKEDDPREKRNSKEEQEIENSLMLFPDVKGEFLFYDSGEWNSFGPLAQQNLRQMLAARDSRCAIERGTQKKKSSQRRILFRGRVPIRCSQLSIIIAGSLFKKLRAMG